MKVAVLKGEERKEAYEEGWWGKEFGGRLFFTTLSVASAKC
jgi:hypothetical protein